MLLTTTLLGRAALVQNGNGGTGHKYYNSIDIVVIYATNVNSQF